MPKKDWKTIITTINTKSPTYLKNFLASNEVFCPSKGFENIFEPSHNAFSSKHLNKLNPANWIPIYREDDLSDYLIENRLMPVRCGQGEFFFYRGEIVFDLRALEHDEVLVENIRLLA